MDIIVKQDSFKDGAILLADKVKASGIKYYGIICVTGGGMHLAYYMSKLLGIKKIQNVNISSYSGKHFSRTRDITDDLKLKEKKKYLVVDDLIDSGKTRDLIRQNYGGCCRQLDFAVLFDKGKSDTPKYYITKIEPRDWVTFYYEQEIDE